MPKINLRYASRMKVRKTSKIDAQNIYQDKRWKKLRGQKLRQNPLCERCECENRVKLADEVHHIVPLQENIDLAFDYNNLQSVCLLCHKIIHLQLKS